MNWYEKTRLDGRVLKASRCVHSSSRCYETRVIPRGKPLFSGAFTNDNKIFRQKFTSMTQKTSQKFPHAFP